METKSQQTTTSTSSTTEPVGYLTIQLMEQIKKEYKKRKKGKTFNESAEGLRKRMAVLADFLKTYNECYCQGVIDAVSASVISTQTEIWLQTVEEAFKNESGSADGSNFSVFTKKAGMSQIEYDMYSIGFEASLNQYHLIMDHVLKTINI